MRYEPFPTVAIAPKLGAGHKKDSPALKPARRVFRPISLLHERHNLTFVVVHVRQPGFGRLAVMPAVDPPVPFDLQVVLKVKKQIVRGHDAAGEKITAHPVSSTAGFVGVCKFPVSEDVDEQFALGRQPCVDSLKQARPVAHVLEHFYRYHAVKNLVRAEIVHVGGDHLEVGQVPFSRLGGDKFPLRRRVRHGDNTALRIALRHPQRQTTPNRSRVPVWSCRR